MQLPRTTTGSSGLVHATDCADTDGYNINLFAHNEADSTSLRHNFITRLYNDSLRNILWISTDQGICSYNYETEDFTRYQIKGNTKDDVCFLNTSDGCSLAAQ